MKKIENDSSVVVGSIDVKFYAMGPIITFKGKEYKDIVNYQHHTVNTGDTIRDVIEFESPLYYEEFETADDKTLKVAVKLFGDGANNPSNFLGCKYEYYTITSSKVFASVLDENCAAYTKYRLYIDNTEGWDWANCSDNQKELDNKN